MVVPFTCQDLEWKKKREKMAREHLEKLKSQTFFIFINNIDRLVIDLLET